MSSIDFSKIEKVYEELTSGDSRVLLCYLYYKKFLNDSQMKQILNGAEFRNSCYGDWRNNCEKRWGIKFE